MRTIWQDVRYGLRMLRRSPGFTLIAVLTLALGIGATTSIFSVVNSVVLNPLPFPQPDRLIWAYGKFPLGDTAGVTGPDFRDYRASARTFEQFAAVIYSNGVANLSGGDKPELVRSLAVSWNFFDAVGIRPALGRSFVAADEQMNLPQVAIIGQGLWKRDFGGDPGVVGRKLVVDGESMTIVGVLPTDLPLLSPAEVWLPIPMLNYGMNLRMGHSLSVLGRMKPGLSLEQARSELDAIAGRLAEEHPDTNKGWSLNALSLRDKIVGSTRPALLLLLGAVGLLLLIACANVANLLLARATSRRKEIAIRAALGAGRWRIVRQMLTESLLLAVGGGTAGILGALWGVSVLRFLAPADLPRLNEIHVNTTVLAFAIGISLAVGILFGLAPGLQFSRNRFGESLKEGGRSSAAPVRHRLSSALVVGEVALSVGLLLSGGLLVKSFWRLIHVDPGFRADHVVTTQLSLPRASYPKASQQAAFFRQVEERATALPGVQAAGAISELPLNGEGGDNPFTIGGHVYEPNQSDDADFRQVSSGYIAAMRIPLLAGRWFNDRDTAKSGGVIVVNEAFAKRYFDGKTPLGNQLNFLGDPLSPREVVGVIGTVSHYSLGEAPRPEMYVPLGQYPSGKMTLVVRAAGEPLLLTAALREVVHGIDKDQAISAARTMDDVLAGSVAQPKFSAELLGLFAVFAVLLAAVGLYGLIAYTVTQQTHEIGIRMALGAQPRDILRMVLGRGGRMALLGISLGLAASLGLTRVIENLLFGIRATDPLTYVAVTTVLFGVTMIASYIPARRAMRVDPMVALRYE